MKPDIVYIATPTEGLSKETVRQNLQSARDEFKRRFPALGKPGNVIFEDPLNLQDPPTECEFDRVWYLGSALEIMAQCDAVFFYGDWQHDLECRYLHLVCQQYGMTYSEV